MLAGSMNKKRKLHEMSGGAPSNQHEAMNVLKAELTDTQTALVLANGTINELRNLLSQSEIQNP